MFVAEEFLNLLKVRLIYSGRFHEQWVTRSLFRNMNFRHWSENNKPNSKDFSTKKVAKRQIKSKHGVRWVFRFHASSPTRFCFRKADGQRYFSRKSCCKTKNIFLQKRYYLHTSIYAFLTRSINTAQLQPPYSPKFASAHLS